MNYTVYKGAGKHFTVLDEHKVGQGLGKKLVMTAQHGKRTSKKRLLRLLKVCNGYCPPDKVFEEEKMQPGESKLIYGFLRCVISEGKLLLCDNTEELV